MTEDLAARIFHYGRSSVWGEESPLFRWELISTKDMGPAEPRAINCDPYIRDWLNGRERTDELLVEAARLCEPRSPIGSRSIQETVEFINRALNGDSSSRLRVTIPVREAVGAGRWRRISALPSDFRCW
jgi:hypothetical protein